MTALRRRISLAAALALALSTASSGGDVAHAVGPVEAVVLNAIDGPAEVDAYIDGQLVAAGVRYGRTSVPFTLSPADGHSSTMFESIASPPARVVDRVDEPLDAGQFLGQPTPGFIVHTTGPVILRVFNHEPGARWFVIEQEVLVEDFSCRPGRPVIGFKGSADILATDGFAASSGENSSGGSRRSVAPGDQHQVVIRGGRSTSFPLAEDAKYTFGSFDFGTVTFQPGFEYFWLAFGHAERYGALEVVVDCATETFASVRTPRPNPTFGSSAFVPVDPVRLFDTREPAPPSGALAPGSTIDVQVTGRVGIPAKNVSAVVLNVTATNSTGPGFVAVFPKGSPRPSTSNVNLTGPNQAVPNLVTVPIGADGKVSFFSLGGVDLLADVAGYFVTAQQSGAGRFVPLQPARVFDTREGPAPVGVVGPASSIRVPIAGKRGVPAAGAAAVVLNLTGVNVGGPGFVTAYPGGTTRPEASNLNLLFPGDVSPNLAIVPLGADGSIAFYSSSGAHVVADVFGYFTDSTQPTSTSGLFVPSSPTRVLDTRPTTFNFFTDDFIAAGGDLDLPITHTGDVPAFGVGAVLANVTATQSAAPGFVTISPTGRKRPEVSNLNQPTADHTRPNAALVPLGDDGKITLYSLSGVHAIVDVFGYFTE